MGDIEERKESGSPSSIKKSTRRDANTELKCSQINCGKSVNYNTILDARGDKLGTDILFIQEPRLFKNKPISIKGGDMFFANSASKKIRAAIWIRKTTASTLKPLLIESLSDQDNCVIKIHLTSCNSKSEILLHSSYMPQLDERNKNINDPKCKTIEKIYEYASGESVEIITSADTNSHHTSWGSDSCNRRGINLYKTMNEYDMNIVNTGKKCTYISGKSSSTIDVTFASTQILEKIKNWVVGDEDCMCDHRFIDFSLNLDGQIYYDILDKKQVNYVKMNRIIKYKINEIDWTCNSADSLNEKADMFNKIITTAYTKSTKIRQCNYKSKNAEWYDSNLAKQNADVNSLRKKYLRSSYENLEANEKAYKSERAEYRRNLKKTKKDFIRKKLTLIDSIKETARIQKIFESSRRNPPTTMNNSDGIPAMSHKETTDILMRTHFPGCSKNPPNYAIAAQDLSANDENTIKSICNYKHIKAKWQNMGQFKAPGADGIFASLLHSTSNHTAPIVSKIIEASIKLNHIPECWRISQVAFIPKPGKENYDNPKSHRPISLISVILKTAESLIKDFIISDVLRNEPFQAEQHAFISGSSCESAIHKLVTQIEIAKESDELLLAVFIDFEGAFDNIKFCKIEEALMKKNIPKWQINWIMNMLNSRMLVKNDELDADTYYPTKGTPQGGVLSPMLFNIVIDDLIETIKDEGNGVTPIVFADDVTIHIRVKKNIAKQAIKNMNNTLKIIKTWSDSVGLSISESKTKCMLFRRSHKLPEDFKQAQIRINDTEIEIVNKLKYLGIYLDHNLNWNEHLNEMKSKGLRTLYATKKVIGQRWGISPKLTLWIYNQIVLPRILYCCFIWWKEGKAMRSKKLNAVRNTALRLTTSCVRNTPIEAIGTLLRVPSIHIKARTRAISTCHRLITSNRWITRNQPNFSNTHRHNAMILRAMNVNEDIVPPPPRHVPFSVYPQEQVNWDRFIGLTKNYTWTILHSNTHPNRFAAASQWSTKFYNFSGNPTHEEAATYISNDILTHLLSKECTRKHVKIGVDSKILAKNLSDKSCWDKQKQSLWSQAEKLNNLKNEISFFWFPYGWKNKFMSDTLSRLEKSSTMKISIKPVNDTLKEKLKHYEEESTIAIWHKITKEAQKGSGKFIYATKAINADENISEYLVKLKREDLRVVIGLKTGRSLCFKYLNKFTSNRINTCRFCKETLEENTEHWIYECDALQIHRHILENTAGVVDIANCYPKDILRYAKITGIKDTFMTNKYENA